MGMGTRLILSYTCVHMGYIRAPILYLLTLYLQTYAIIPQSYGGYMAGMVMSDPDAKGVFKMGMSVAPVTDWKYVYIHVWMSC